MYICVLCLPNNHLCMYVSIMYAYTNGLSIYLSIHLSIYLQSLTVRCKQLNPQFLYCPLDLLPHLLLLVGEHGKFTWKVNACSPSWKVVLASLAGHPHHQSWKHVVWEINMILVCFHEFQFILQFPVYNCCFSLYAYLHKLFNQFPQFHKVESFNQSLNIYYS